MAIDRIDLPKSTENRSPQRPRLLFHVSNLGTNVAEPMTNLGLLANSPTLTPRLDIATHYSGGNMLTFWYPMRGEVNHLRNGSVSTPTTKVTDEIRDAMLNDIASLGVDPWIKDAYTKVVNGASTYLPGSRLRAVAKISALGPTNLELLLPEDKDKFISLYIEKGAELTAEVKREVEKMKIDFLDPTLTKENLAEDILRTYVEHNLLEIGQYPGKSRADLERNLKALEGGVFDDPTYERYRKMLVSQIQKKMRHIIGNQDESS